MVWSHVQIPVGAVALYESCRLPYKGMRKNLEGKGIQEDFENFDYLVKEACIRTTTRFILENEIEEENLSLAEQLKLQAYDFNVYLRSCKFIEFDSCPRQLLKDKMLDEKRFAALNQEKYVPFFVPCRELLPLRIYDHNPTKFVEILEHHVNELKEFELVDEIYACRKSLANCKFIKCDSDFNKIFGQLKENWTNVSDDVLNIALRQHFSLLHTLESNNKATNGILNKPTKLLSSDIQGIIDREYRTELHKFVWKRLEGRFEGYHQDVEFRHFFTQGVADFDASGIDYVPKSMTTPGDQRTPRMLPPKLAVLLYKLKKLPKRKDAVKLLSGVEGSGISKGPLLNNAWGKSMVRSAKGWTALIAAAGAALVSTGLGVSRKEDVVV